MFKKISLLLTGIVFALSACAAAASQAPSKQYSVDNDAGNADPVMPAPGDAAGYYDYTFQESNAGETGNVPQVDRLVIKNANLKIVVSNPEKASQGIAAMAEELGGYVVSANVYQTYLTGDTKVPQASITIRVPAEKLNDVLAEIKALSTEDVISEDISSQDVTAEYTDLQSRLRNAEAAEVELARIMEEANKTEDVLNVYAQLKAVREEIEVLKGQIQYYEQSAAFSMISVELVAKESVQPIEIGGWEPKGVARDAVQALVDIMQFFANLAIWFVLFCFPTILVLGVPMAILIVIARTLLQKTRKQPKPKPPLPPAPSHDAPVA